MSGAQVTSFCGSFEDEDEDECDSCECVPCVCDEYDRHARRLPTFELVYGGSNVIVGPCSGADRDELIKLWGREPDAGRVVV